MQAKSAPVVKPESSLASQATQSATSCAVPSRPRGIPSSIFARAASGIPAVMSVRGCLARLVNGTRVRVDGTAGRVTLDALSERARANYLYARAVVGREFATPRVVPDGLN
mgnify:CR=1 FL=1